MCSAVPQGGFFLCSGNGYSGYENFRYGQCRHERNFDLLILRNRFLKLGKVHIWLVSPFYVVDLLILRNCIIRPRNVRICVVLSCKVVIPLIITNSVFKLKNV